MNDRILTYDQAVEKLVSISGTKVLVGGCFDIVHVGHIRFLEAARKEGDILIVALESDEFITSRKHRKAYQMQIHRAKILAALRFVDFVILLPFFTSDQEYEQLVMRIAPHIIAVTKGDPLTDKKKRYIEKCDGELKEVIPFVEDYSTSKILEKLDNKSS